MELPAGKAVPAFSSPLTQWEGKMKLRKCEQKTSGQGTGVAQRNNYFNDFQRLREKVSHRTRMDSFNISHGTSCGK